MNEYQYRITELVYDWIIKGIKNIEVRLYNEKSSKIKVNDIINFKVINKDNKNVRVKVIDLFIYEDINTLLNEKDINKIAPLKKDEIVGMLINIYDEEKMNNHNIIGIQFEVISDKNE